MTASDPLDAPVSRREFESAIHGISQQITALRADLDTRKPGLANLITLGVLIMSVVVAGVQNFSSTRALQTWADSHEAFSQAKAAEFARDISGLQSRQARNVTILDEQEMQHRWIADVFNLRMQHVEHTLRMLHPEVPASDYWPLGEIGKATGAGED